MPKRLVIIQGHPDASQKHFGHALAQAYAQGATGAGHQVTTLNVAELDIPLLHSPQEWKAPAPPGVVKAQTAIAAADLVVIFYPLWLGGMPALLKGFLEQILRPDFVSGPKEQGKSTRPLKGKQARIVITMGMPALLYRLFFCAHSLKSLKRNILQFVGIRPVRSTLIGLIEGMSDARRARWLETMKALGARAV